MTVEELLKPRYKVIADYPESPYKVGDIEYNEGWSDALSLEDFPAIFRKLEWWESRAGLPMYVRHKMFDTAFRVVSHFHDNRGDASGWPYRPNEDSFVFEFDGNLETGMYYDHLPATEEEYKNQKK